MERAKSMANRIHSNGGPPRHQPPQRAPRSAPVPPISGPAAATADWVSGPKNQSQPGLRRLKKKQREKARRQRRGEEKRDTAQSNKQVVLGQAQHEAFADGKSQAADPAAPSSRRTQDAAPSNQTAVADRKQAAGEIRDKKAFGDCKNQGADPPAAAATRRTEHVSSSSQVAVGAAGAAGALIVEVGAGVRAEVDVAARTEVEAEEPFSSSAVIVTTTVRDIAENQQAFARRRLGSLLLPLINNKLRRSKAGGKKTVTMEQLAAAIALEEAGENVSPKHSAAEMAKVLRAEAVRLEAAAVVAKAYAKECAGRLAEELSLEERLLEEVIKELDSRAQELSLKKKTYGSALLDEADKAFLEMYTGKTLAEHGLAHDGSHDSGSTCEVNSSDSTADDDKEHSDGPGSEGQQCLPPSPAARSPMPPVQQAHFGVCLVDFGGTFYPVSPLPVQQQQQAGQVWVPGGYYSSDAGHQTPTTQYAHPQAMAYEEEGVWGAGMCSTSATQQYAPPPQALTRDETFADMCPAPVLPTQRYAPSPPMAYGGDAAYPVQMPHEQPLHTAYRGSTEGSVYPLEAPQYHHQPFCTSEGHFGWGVYNQPPILGYEGGGW